MDILHLDKSTLWVIVVVGWALASNVSKLLKKLRQQSRASASERPSPQRDQRPEAKPLDSDPRGGVEPPSTEVLAGFAEDWRRRADQVEERATAMTSRFVYEPRNRPFLEVTGEYIPELLREARAALRAAEISTAQSGAARVAEAEELLRLVAVLSDRRRDEALAPLLTEADRLTESCYRPVLTFAQSQGLSIASNHPLTLLGGFDLGIWTELIPTTIAPIFLPPDFFNRASWWPALPHEIGHDFYASLKGLDGSMRAELGLPSEAGGRRIIRVSTGSVPMSEIRRVFGAWFEELFCDVFATMMTGPAYVVSMLELFAQPDHPRAVITADLAADGYDVHPPRHLRFLMACEILAMLGFGADVATLREAWEGEHGGAERLQELIMPTDVGYLGFPLEPFTVVAFAVAERLYRGPIAAFGGRGLSGISGLDYGPHRHNETNRARDALLAGHVPRVRDVRAVVAGAALAAHRAPDLEERILVLARSAIPAAGTRESRAASRARVGAKRDDAPLGHLNRRAVVEALVLNEILRRPQRGTRFRASGPAERVSPGSSSEAE